MWYLFMSFLVFLTYFSSLEALKIDKTKSDILPSKKVCGFKHCEAYPWLVFIPLESRVNNPDANLRCAGVLISKRYVLTNMGCLQFVLTKVHLGQLDVTKNVTCENKPVLKIDVESKVVDEPSEIVVLRLAEDVEFSDEIKPICLPFEDFKRAETESEVFTSGWGSTSYQGKKANIMKKVKTTMMTNEDCQDSGVIKDASNDGVMCVQQDENEFDFPCGGDEGSPIMYSSDGQWILEGILAWLLDSSGQPCAIENPARGSRITEKVLQWIVDNVHA